MAGLTYDINQNQREYSFATRGDRIRIRIYVSPFMVIKEFWNFDMVTNGRKGEEGAKETPQGRTIMENSRIGFEGDRQNIRSQGGWRRHQAESDSEG